MYSTVILSFVITFYYKNNGLLTNIDQIPT